ncbi:C39 family peptidase [Brochothrix campestris]|uniref:C39 family peptidase n=2 Tax=Brochothrix campestris TaxID=2757 RepID=UPI0038D04CB1
MMTAISLIMVVLFVFAIREQIEAKKAEKTNAVVQIEQALTKAEQNLTTADIAKAEAVLKTATHLTDTSDYAKTIERIKQRQVKKKQQQQAQQLDVPLINQMDAPRLFNGCEVTSLAMLLNYEGVTVTKNELAQRIPTVPLTYDNGQKGNPHEGFVGSVSGDTPGIGVYHEPIATLAKQYVASDRVRDISGESFEKVLAAVLEGYPVWIITTSSFTPVTSMQEWQTPTETLEMTYDMHSVVITGFDQTHIYINNPYGEKKQQLKRSDFIAAWKQMGQQAVYISK